MRIGMLILLFSSCMAACGIQEQRPLPQFGDGNFLVERGTLYLILGDLKRAEAEYSLALELAPLAAAVDGLGCVAMLRRDFDRAEKLFRRAYEMDRTYNHSLANLALLYELRGDTAKAEESYRKETNLEPKDFRARHNYALMRYATGAGKDEVEMLLLQAQAIAPHPIIAQSLAYLNEEE